MSGSPVMTGAAAPDESTLVSMGYIAGAFGVRGWVKIHADTEYADSLFDYPRWWVGRPGGAGAPTRWKMARCTAKAWPPSSKACWIVTRLR